MLKFLFGGRGKAVVETQRQTIERLSAELNSAIELLPVKPRVTLDPETGHIELHLPEQMPDEALALPAPDSPEKPADTDEDTPKSDGKEVA